MNNKHLIGRGMSIIHRYRHIYVRNKLKDLSVGNGHIMLLMSLYHKEGIKQDDLVHIMKLDKGTVARGIKKLEIKGYIRKKIDEKDKRAYKLYLTNKGYEIKPKIFQTLNEWMNIITKGLSKEEVQEGIRIIEKMAVNACEHLGDRKLAEHLRKGDYNEREK